MQRSSDRNDEPAIASGVEICPGSNMGEIGVDPSASVSHVLPPKGHGIDDDLPKYSNCFSSQSTFSAALLGALYRTRNSYFPESGH